MESIPTSRSVKQTSEHKDQFPCKNFENEISVNCFRITRGETCSPWKLIIGSLNPFEGWQPRALGSAPCAPPPGPCCGNQTPPCLACVGVMGVVVSLGCVHINRLKPSFIMLRGDLRFVVPGLGNKWFCFGIKSKRELSARVERCCYPRSGSILSAIPEPLVTSA